MNDNTLYRIRCPFFLAYNNGRGNNITITCEEIHSNLGFEVHNKLDFLNRTEREDWMEVFCMDRYEGCPYYQGIYNTKYGGKHGNRTETEKRNRALREKDSRFET